MAFAFAPASSFAGMAVRGSVQVTSPRPVRAARFTMSGGKGFGGGEATRNPDATPIDPNDPKGKQKAIHPVETFAEYQARVAREKAEKEGK